MSDIFRDFDKKNEVPKHKTGLADEITQALGINGVYVSVGLTNKEMHLNKLDFTEHDKVFEDKIELLNRNLNLQKDKRCEAEIERNYLAERINQLKGENEELKQKISDLECLMQKRDEFLEMKNIQIEELKQRIAELESKETEKPKKRTGVIVAREIDRQIYVTLDDFMSVVNDLQAEIGT